MSRPKLLDLYCCAGGAGMGYARAGFDVTGVDIEPQANYQAGRFVQADAVEFISARGHEYDAIHASPPCQAYSPLNAYNHKEYPDLIAPTRDAILATGKPYVIENVEAARGELINPILLCGPSFGLKMYRHRLFEVSFHAAEPMHWDHEELCARNGYLPTPERSFMTITGGKHSAAWMKAAAAAMGTPWMRTIREVCESIPPAYTDWLGWQIIDHLEQVAA